MRSIIILLTRPGVYLIKKVLPDYLNQYFMGTKCTLSDDRYLTHNIQTRFGKRIIFADKSVCETYIPTKFRPMYKMFKRWRVGGLREGFLVLKQFKKHPLLVLDVWANNLIAFMQTSVRISVIITAFFYPMVLLYYIIIISIISLMFSFHMIFNNIRELPYKIMYSLMNEVYFGWIYIHALFTIKQQGSWNTR